MAKVSKRLRYEILRRDGFRCRYCGATPEERELRVDHVIPEALGGPTEPSNLAASCDPCNNGKSSTTPDAPVVADVAEGALRWATAMEAAAAAMEQKIQERRDKNAFFPEVWQQYKLDSGSQAVPLPPDWEGAITRLEAAGLTRVLLEEAVEAAMKPHNVRPENRFRYFCGVAWNMVTALQEAARVLADNAGGPVADVDPGDPYAMISRADLESAVWRFEVQTERLLKALPGWVQESAEREARADWHNADNPEPPPHEGLPDVLRHLSGIISTCNIQPGREGEI